MKTQNSNIKIMSVIALVILLAAGLSMGSRIFDNLQSFENSVNVIKHKIADNAQRLDRLNDDLKTAAITKSVHKKSESKPRKDLEKNLAVQLNAIIESINEIKTQVNNLESAIDSEKLNSNTLAVATANLNSHHIQAIASKSQASSDATLKSENHFKTLNSKFTQSAFDPSWSIGTEQLITDAHEQFASVTQDHGSNVLQQECRTQMCKVIVSHSDPMQADQYQKNLMLGVRKSLPKFSMQSEHKNGLITNTYYFHAVNETSAH